MPNFPSPKRTKPKEKSTRVGSKETEPRYHTKAWRAARLDALQREPLCRICDSMGYVTLAQMVDHITPVRLGGDFWDADNHQPLCNSCHAVKSQSERGLTPAPSSED